MDMLEMVKRLFRRRYVAALEADVERLRGENRALMNSLLGTAGFPPVEYPATAPVALPAVRKRSWHQIQAMKEAEARKTQAERQQQTR